MIEELNKIDLPWSLLLDADPDKEKVQVYVSKGNGWIWKEKEKTIGILIYIVREKEFEIVNVAVEPSHQGKGIGGKLLETAFQKLSQLASSQTQITSYEPAVLAVLRYISIKKWAMWRLVESKTILSIIILNRFLRTENNCEIK